MTTYRLEYAGGAPLIRILAEEGDTTREIATCRGSGEQWPQAVKNAELIVAALNAHDGR